MLTILYRIRPRFVTRRSCARKSTWQRTSAIVVVIADSTTTRVIVTADAMPSGRLALVATSVVLVIARLP